MTAEELIDCLPGCSPAVIVNSWAPAMGKEYERIKKLLHNAAEVNLESNVELKDFGTVRPLLFLCLSLTLVTIH